MELDRGYLIVIEGIDGTGKSTQCKLLTEYLERRGVSVLQLYEPTHGVWGKKVRKILVEGRDGISPEEELSYFIKDRQENVANNILPALKEKKAVLMDRYYYSTAAYQGAIGLDPEQIRRDNEAFAPVPDLVLMFMVPPEECLRRIREDRNEEPNTFEKIEYLQKVQSIFDSFSGAHIVRIDATPPLDEVYKRLQGEIDRLIGL